MFMRLPARGPAESHGGSGGSDRIGRGPGTKTEILSKTLSDPGGGTSEDIPPAREIAAAQS